jgi:hypothetical protein
MPKKPKPIKVTWEYEHSSDAEERLAQAFEMIFKKMGEDQKSLIEERPKKQGVLFRLKRRLWK